MPPTQDTLGDTLKIIQITFYTIGTIIAILTYLAAKRGLLNTVNTEYQKRVMDRLHKLSEDLYSEFDPSSPMYWANIRPVHNAIQQINEVFENNKDEILTERKFYYGTPYTKDVKRLQHLLDPVVSDPFIPDNIRTAVIDLLKTRLHVLHGIYICEFEKYTDNLAKGKHSPLTELDDVNNIHNKIVKKQKMQGCGVAQIEEEVHEIRGLIQDYFSSFNPHRRWWDRKKHPAKKVDILR
jgi:tetrahydromethanopterin S-methyltransferase subunit B